MSHDLGARLRVPMRKSELNSKPEDLHRATRVVAGSVSCKGKDDAELLLQALGLIPYRERNG